MTTATDVLRRARSRWGERGLPAAAGPGDGVHRLVVRHDLAGEPAHTQVWVGEHLVRWTEGGAVPPDIVVARDAEVDAADLAGTADPGQVAGATDVSVGPLRSLDVLGTGGAVAKEVDGWTIETATTCRLDLVGSPFGDLPAHLSWRDAALVVVVGDGRPADVEIEMPYADALRWLWTDLVLGHLFSRGLRAQAEDLFRLSEVEGMVSCPSQGPSRAPVADVLARYARARRGPDGQALAGCVRAAIMDR